VGAGNANTTLTPASPSSSSAGTTTSERDFEYELNYLSTLGLGHARGFSYLNQTGCYTIEGVVDAEALHTTLLALRRTGGFTPADVCTILRVLAAILHIGQIEITSAGAAGAGGAGGAGAGAAAGAGGASGLRELDVRTVAALLHIEPKALLHHLQFRYVELIKGGCGCREVCVLVFLV
jgi:hypothetical protein